MFLLQQFLPSVLVAALACAVVLIPGGLVSRAGPSLAPLALALGYIGGHIKADGLPGMPVHNATEWLVWMAAAGAIAGIVDAIWKIGRVWRSALWLLVCGISFAALVDGGFLYHAWNKLEWAVHLGIVTGGGLLLGSSFNRIAGPDVSPVPLALIVLSAGFWTAVALMTSGSLLLGQFGCIFTTAAGVLLVGVMIFRRAFPTLRGIVPAATLLLIGLLASGVVYSELHPVVAILLFLSPVVAILIPFRPSNPKLRLLSQVGTMNVVGMAAFIGQIFDQPAYGL